MVPGRMNVVRNKHGAQVGVVADNAYVARQRKVQTGADSRATDGGNGCERTSVKRFEGPVDSTEILQRIWCAAGNSLQQVDVGPRAEGLRCSGQNKRATARFTD